jgi:predicted RNase H-like nuclease (RuvC/YqgF family)
VSFSVSPAQVMARLDSLAGELDGLSKALTQTERELEPLEVRYEEFVGDWEASLWEESKISETKWPPETLRSRMAHRAISSELLGSMNAAQAKRRRLEKRISTIRVLVDSQRSILSALKEEMAATR